SGILAIAALLMGAEHAIGIDIDPQALTSSLNNATKNNVQDRFNICNTQHYPTTACDIVIANILADPLITFAKEISALVKPGGQLVLSGILSEQIESVQKTYEGHFIFEASRIRDNWACLCAAKK
ncbi:MAG: 50S ribosomal protein L11 methyltransferase, partial [Piscirickettsiaceae bacterium]